MHRSHRRRPPVSIRRHGRPRGRSGGRSPSAGVRGRRNGIRVGPADGDQLRRAPRTAIRHPPQPDLHRVVRVGHVEVVGPGDLRGRAVAVDVQERETVVRACRCCGRTARRSTEGPHQNPAVAGHPRPRPPRWDNGGDGTGRGRGRGTAGGRFIRGWRRETGENARLRRPESRRPSRGRSRRPSRRRSAASDPSSRARTRWCAARTAPTSSPTSRSPPPSASRRAPPSWRASSPRRCTATTARSRTSAVSGPGFLNITTADEALWRQLGAAPGRRAARGRPSPSRAPAWSSTTRRPTSPRRCTSGTCARRSSATAWRACSATWAPP